jgi:ABC-type branched-subunit amino acid transport system substrate-binding protein
MTLRVGTCLSLSGEYARFGARAAQALYTWQTTDDSVELIVEDDRSSVHTLRETLPGVASRCDILLGPYATHLARAAADVAAERGLLLWNHGGAGDDVQASHPGHVVSVPTPASRYAEPFLRRLAGEPSAPLWITHGGGRFGRQAAAGAERLALRLGIDTMRIADTADLPHDPGTPAWDLFTAGSFDDDVRTVNHARTLVHPPRAICAVAAGIAEFRHAVTDPEGIFGISQWIPDRTRVPELGPTATDFRDAYTRLAGSAPDYPAAQAAAAGILAVECARLAKATTRDALWSTATALNTRTLFGPFQINPVTGVQIGHDTLLVRWAEREIRPA